MPPYLLIHADVLDVVQLAEDTQLGEFRNARQEHITQVWVAGLQRTIEVSHHVAEGRQVLFLVNHIQERSVVLESGLPLLAGLQAAFDKDSLNKAWLLSIPSPRQ